VLDADTTAFNAKLKASEGAVGSLEDKVSGADETLSDFGRAATEAGESAATGLGHAAAETDNFSKSFEDLAGHIAAAQEGFRIAIEAAEEIGEAFREMVEHSIEAGSEAQNTAIEFRNAFGEGAEDVEKWAETTGNALGRASDDIEKLATQAKFMISGFGVAGQQATEMSTSLAQLEVLTAKARFNGDDQAAFTALSGALRGAGRQAAALGIAINSTTQNQEAMREGLGNTYTTLTASQQLFVNYNLIMEHYGVLAKEAASASDTYSNTLANLKSHYDDVWQGLGEQLLPSMTDLVKAVDMLSEWFNGLSDSTKEFISYALVEAAAIASVTVFALSLAIALPSLVEGFELVGKALAEVGITGAADLLPIIATVAAVAAGIAGLILIVHEFHKLWDAESSAVKSAASSVVDWFVSEFDRVSGWLPGWAKTAIGYLVNPFDAMKDAVFGSTETLLMAMTSVASAAGKSDWAAELNAEVETLKKDQANFWGSLGSMALSAGKSAASAIGTAAKAVGGLIVSGAKQVGHEFSEAIGLDGLLKKFHEAKDALLKAPGQLKAPGSGAASGDAAFQKQLAAAKELADFQKQVDDARAKLAESGLREAQVAAQLQVRAAQEAYGFQQAAAQLAVKQANDQLSKAQQAFGEAGQHGSTSDIQAARRAVDDAEAKVQSTMAAVLQLDQQHIATMNAALEASRTAQDAALQEALDKRMEAEQAIEDFKAAQQALLASKDGTHARELAQIALDAAKQRMDLDVQAAQKASAEYNKAGVDVQRAAAAAAKAQKEAADYMSEKDIQAANEAAKIQKEAAAEADRIHQAAGGLASSFATQAGGKYVGAAVQGAETGAAAGPWGALIGAILGVLEQSAAFQKLVDTANESLGQLVDAFGQLLEPLNSLTEATGKVLQPLFNGLGNFLRQIIQIIVDLLEPALEFLSPILKALGTLFDGLATVFGWLEEVIRKGMNAIIDGYNKLFGKLFGHIAEIEDPATAETIAVYQSVQEKYEAAKAAAESANAANEAAQVELQRNSVSYMAASQAADEAAAANRALADATNALVQLQSEYTRAQQAAIDAVNSTVQGGHSGVANAEGTASNADAKVALDNATIAAVQEAMARAGDPDVVAQLAKTLASEQQQLTLDEDARAIANAQLRVAQDQLLYAQSMLDSTRAGVEYTKALVFQNEGLAQEAAYATDSADADMAQAIAEMQNYNNDIGAANQAVADALAQQALDQAAITVANSISTDANTKAINDLNTTLTNAPSGFRVQHYEDVGLGVGGGGASSNPLFDASQQPPRRLNGAAIQGITVQSLTINSSAPDSDSLFKEIAGKLRTLTVKKAGVALLTPRFG